MRQRRYRLLLEHCSGGSLSGAMHLHDVRWQHQIVRKNVHVAREPDCLPEGFIWGVIKAITSACLVLQTGRIQGEHVENWKPITHLDIQAPNILLRREDKMPLEHDDSINDEPTAENGKRKAEQSAGDGPAPKKPREDKLVSTHSLLPRLFDLTETDSHSLHTLCQFLPTLDYPSTATVEKMII